MAKTSKADRLRGKHRGKEKQQQEGSKGVTVVWNQSSSVKVPSKPLPLCPRISWRFLSMVSFVMRKYKLYFGLSTWSG